MCSRYDADDLRDIREETTVDHALEDFLEDPEADDLRREGDEERREAMNRLAEDPSYNSQL